MRKAGRLVVDFNEKGQPIRRISNMFSSYLGAIARTRVPISFTTWHNVPKDTKEKYWIEVKKKFIVPETAKKRTLRMIGKDWRGYKVRLRKQYYDAYSNDKDRIAACPKGIFLNDWKEFVAHNSTDKYKRLRQKAKEAIKNHKLPHTCSRKGYARLEDEMDQLNDKDCTTICGKDDALSQVLGPDPPGCLRGVGYGVTSSTLFGVQQCLGLVNHMEEKYQLVLKELSSLHELVMKSGNPEPSHSCVQPPDAPQTQELSTENIGNLDVQNTLSSQPFVEAPKGQKSLPKQGNKNLQTVRTPLRVVKCKLFRLIPEDVVAEGYWYTDDPLVKLHNLPLGSGYSKVSIELAVQKDALLVGVLTNLRQ